ncbi:MAG: hypothetical protein ACEY26_00820 [Candidatus Hodgkinia cicadicola]
MYITLSGTKVDVTAVAVKANMKIHVMITPASQVAITLRSKYRLKLRKLTIVKAF